MHLRFNQALKASGSISEKTWERESKKQIKTYENDS